MTDAMWESPRSTIRMLAAQDPAEAAHRIIELQAERDGYREALNRYFAALRAIASPSGKSVEQAEQIARRALEEEKR